MQQLQETEYRPPFITETDETRWDDCTVCSTLMATAVATLGETVYGQDWRPLNARQIKVLRERIRNHLGPDKQSGGTSMADMRLAFGKEYPWLPKIPFYDEQNNTWEEFMDSLSSKKSVFVVMGNPALVKNVNSRLRRWTNSDNFGHAILALERRVSNGVAQVFIMDPLGRGDYDGEWVPASELKQFTWTFGSFVKVNGFPRAGWTRADRRTSELIKKVKTLKEGLLDAERAVANIVGRLQTTQAAKQAAEKALEVAKNAAGSAEAARAACQIALGNLETDNTALQEELESANKALAECSETAIIMNSQVLALDAQVAEQEGKIAALEAERDGALQRAADEQARAVAAESALATCIGVNQRQSASLKRRLAIIKELRRQLAEVNVGP